NWTNGSSFTRAKMYCGVTTGIIPATYTSAQKTTYVDTFNKAHTDLRTGPAGLNQCMVAMVTGTKNTNTNYLPNCTKIQPTVNASAVATLPIATQVAEYNTCTSGFAPNP